jgi:hypothetical protein
MATQRRRNGDHVANRGNGENPATDGTTAATAPDATAADAMEQRVIAFAEQLGRMVGTIQAKADGWLDGETLPKQIATIRDEATRLLDQLTGGAKKATKKAAAAAAGARRAGKGRSGGVVDAPGKKHRKKAPTDPKAKTTRSQADKMRMAKTMVKTQRRRGRG